MKRLALLAPLVFGCIDFNTELDNRLAMLDGGGTDAGTSDAGAPDAGCPGPSPCLVASVKTGSAVMRMGSLSDGTFLGLVLTVARDEAGNVLSSSGGLVGAPDGGAYKPLSLPRVPYGDGDAGSMTDTISWPVALAIRGTTIAVGDYNGYAAIIDLPTKTVIASTSTCHFADDQSYNSAAWFDDDTVYFAASELAGSGGSHICKWNRTTHFTRIDLNAETDAGDYSLEAVAVIGGELFVGNDNGNLFTTYGATMNAPHVWSASSTNIAWSSISGTSAAQTWASGKQLFSNAGALAKFDPGAGSWVEQPSPPAMNVTGDLGLWQVLVVAPTDLWLVGEYGNVFHSTGDGNWDSVSLPLVDAATTVWSVASHGPKDLAVGVEHNLPDGGSQGELLVYTRP
jgi:hypothetical protein